MHEAEPPGMQGLTPKGRDALADRARSGDGPPGARAVKRIADQRMAEMREMNADLVRPPRGKPALKDRGVGLECALDPVVCDRGFTLSISDNRHFFTVHRTSAD